MDLCRIVHSKQNRGAANGNAADGQAKSEAAREPAPQPSLAVVRAIDLDPTVESRSGARSVQGRRAAGIGAPTLLPRGLRGVKHQHFAQMPEQLLFLVRLAQIYLDTQFLGAIAVLLGRARRDHDDGYVG